MSASETAAAYALGILPNAVSSSSSTLTTLYSCLFEDRNCRTFLGHGAVEAVNIAARTGTNLGMGTALTPPSYYTSIYKGSNGQAFVRARGEYYRRAEHGLAQRAREQGRHPGLERFHRARKAYEL